MLLKYYHNTNETGTDEAGRGCLAGPVTAAAIILPESFENTILTDSKLLSERKRELLEP
ncbi:MAG: ribonuclease HII, partial [Maribacter sp.]|nr:ribonuclease HII [Maribacter sp.]